MAYKSRFIIAEVYWLKLSYYSLFSSQNLFLSKSGLAPYVYKVSKNKIGFRIFDN